MTRTIKKGILATVSVAWAAVGLSALVATSEGGTQGSNGAGPGAVGSRACAECHAGIVAAHAATPMAHALATAADSPLLKAVLPMPFAEGRFKYEIRRRGAETVFVVTDGKATIAEPILYAFGRGEIGQTYVFRHGDALIESRVSYYSGIRGLDVTIGQERAVPATLEAALGRPLGAAEAAACFACHAPEAARGGTLRLDGARLGVTCEGCHGPGEKHVLAMKAGRYEPTEIENPGRRNAFDLSQGFCGSCHTSFEHALQMTEQGGANNIRFQPYRMFNSPGHRTSDARSSCVACHDPHEPVAKRARDYDAACLACHVSDAKEPKTAARPADACPVAKAECVTCHMPKVKLEGMHASFTDHWIRVVRPGEPTPH